MVADCIRLRVSIEPTPSIGIQLCDEMGGGAGPAVRGYSESER